MLIPPSTASVAPVTRLLSSLARKSTAGDLVDRGVPGRRDHQVLDLTAC